MATQTLIIPTSASELHALCNQQRAIASNRHGDVADIAAWLKTHLPAVIERRGGTRTGLLGIDGKIMANRVVHPLRQISKLEDEISRGWVTVWVRYQENVQNVRTNKGHGQFDDEG
jgi:hypothetical protein